jgi:hypothetical protein
MTIPKRRILESPAGQGKIYQEDKFIQTVNYNLIHYKEGLTANSFGGSSEVEGMRGIEGSLSGGQFFNLVGERLTLHLNDGRRLNFFFRHSNGLIVGDGNFYQAT